VTASQSFEKADMNRLEKVAASRSERNQSWLLKFNWCAFVTMFDRISQLQRNPEDWTR
jgi:hypothetical protein